MTPQDEIAALKAENARLREEAEALGALVQELQGRLAKDSHNSGKSPSSDGLGRKTRSPRKKSGKKPGGQVGHRGETLRLAAVADEVIEHRPARCGRIAGRLRTATGLRPTTGPPADYRASRAPLALSRLCARDRWRHPGGGAESGA